MAMGNNPQGVLETTEIPEQETPVDQLENSDLMILLRRRLNSEGAKPVLSATMIALDRRFEENNVVRLNRTPSFTLDAALWAVDVSQNPQVWYVRNYTTQSYDRFGSPTTNANITAPQVRDLLQTLTGDDRLDASAVKNLDLYLPPGQGTGGLTLDQIIAGFNARSNFLNRGVLMQAVRDGVYTFGYQGQAQPQLDFFYNEPLALSWATTADGATREISIPVNNTLQGTDGWALSLSAQFKTYRLGPCNATNDRVNYNFFITEL